jgi:uncharacterized membrane protein
MQSFQILDHVMLASDTVFRKSEVYHTNFIINIIILKICFLSVSTYVWSVYANCNAVVITGWVYGAETFLRS